VLARDLDKVAGAARVQHLRTPLRMQIRAAQLKAWRRDGCSARHACIIPRGHSREPARRGHNRPFPGVAAAVPTSEDSHGNTTDSPRFRADVKAQSEPAAGRPRPSVHEKEPALRGQSAPRAARCTRCRAHDRRAAHAGNTWAVSVSKPRRLTPARGRRAVAVSPTCPSGVHRHSIGARQPQPPASPLSPPLSQSPATGSEVRPA
jgi:hypothetical protein